MVPLYSINHYTNSIQDYHFKHKLQKHCYSPYDCRANMSMDNLNNHIVLQ